MLLFIYSQIHVQNRKIDLLPNCNVYSKWLIIVLERPQSLDGSKLKVAEGWLSSRRDTDLVLVNTCSDGGAPKMLRQIFEYKPTEIWVG